MKPIKFTITDEQVDVIIGKEVLIKKREEFTDEELQTLINELLDYKNQYRNWIEAKEDIDDFKLGMDEDDYYDRVNLDDKEDNLRDMEDDADYTLNSIIAQFKPILTIQEYLDGTLILEGDKLYFKGVEDPIPNMLANRIIGLIKEGQQDKMGYLIAFAQRCMENPDPVAREGLYGFLMHNGHPITKQGYFITQKAVYKKEVESPVNNEVAAFVKQEFEKRRSQKKGTRNVMVELRGNKNLMLTEYVEGCISLFDHYQMVIAWEAEQSEEDIYTDIHSGTTTIRLNQPVTMPREDCDNNPNQTCSSGLKCVASL